MTEKEKAIEDETIEVSAESYGKENKEAASRKGHRHQRRRRHSHCSRREASPGRRTRIASWPRPGRTARPRCERLRTSRRTTWNTLSERQGRGGTRRRPIVKSVKDVKMLDALSKTMKAIDAEDRVLQGGFEGPAWSGGREGHHRERGMVLRRMRRRCPRPVKAVETSKLDKTVDDAQRALRRRPPGRWQDDKTRASLLDAIKKRDADAIGKSRERR